MSDKVSENKENGVADNGDSFEDFGFGASAGRKTVVADDDKASGGSQLTDEQKKINAENAAKINDIAKLKNINSSVNKSSSNVNPVSRPSVRDIKMGLTGKIIPKTEEIERPKLADNATFEEKTEFVNKNRKKKVENFELKPAKDEKKKKEKPSPDKEKSENASGQQEFKSFEEAPKILSDILQVKSNLFIRLCILIFTGVFSLVVTISNDFDISVLKIFDKTISPGGYIFTNTMLGLIALGASYTVLLSGIKNIINRRADCDSLAAIGIFTSVIAGIANLFAPESLREGYYHIYISVAIVGLIFNTVGKMMIVKRTERNFRYVAGEYDRYAITNVSNEDAANNFTNGMLDDFPELATMRRTEFIDDFMKNSYSSDVSDELAKKASPIILVAGVVVALLSILFDKNPTNTAERVFTVLAAFSGVATMCCSISIMLVVNLPLERATKKYLQFSSVMLGYSAVDEFADTNSVLVDADQLFPDGMVDLIHLKLLSATSIEECILMAASLSCQAGSVMQSVFYKMLRGKTEMLYPVESYIYEDGQGLSGWIENKRVLLGTRELMENHSIDGLPTLAKEKEYSGGNTVVYLSVSGVVSMLFVVTVNASLSVKTWMRELEDEGIAVVIRTIDGFLTKNFLAGLFGISEDSIRLLPFRFHEQYEAETDYVPKTSSSMLCSGHFPSFAMLLIGAKRLKFLSHIGIVIQYGGILLGVVLSLIMMLSGSFSQITPTFVLCYNLIVGAITLLCQHIKRV